MSDLFHYFEPLLNTDTGAARIGYFIRLIDPSTLAVVDIYADANSTPISSVSGQTNMAKSDENGNVSLFVIPGTYHLDIYGTDATTFLLRVENYGMTSTVGPQGPKGDPGAAGNVASTLAELKAALVTNDTMIYDHATFKWSTGDYTGQADDVNIIESDLAAISTGAWVRQSVASLVFQQAGSGTIARTSQDKHRETISVKDFGAKGDGVNDDTAAINLAVAAIKVLGGGRLVFPRGTYLITSTINAKGSFTEGLEIQGNHSRIVVSGNFTGMEVNGSIPEPSNGFAMMHVIEGLKFQGTTARNTNTAAKGLAIKAGAHVVVRDCQFINFYHGMYCYGNLISHYTNLYVGACSIGVELAYDGTFAPNDINFYDCSFLSNTQSLKSSGNPNGTVTIQGTDFEGNNTGGTTTDGVKNVEFSNAGQITLIGCHFETNPGQYNLYFDGNSSARLNVIGCLMIPGTACGNALYTDTISGASTVIITGSRIINSTAGANNLYLGTSVTAIIFGDIAGGIQGDLSRLSMFRNGLMSFGTLPGGAPISINPAPIVANANVAMQFQNDTVQLKWLNTAGTRVCYFQTSASGDHVWVNNNAAGGWGFQANSAYRFYIGRGGAASVEPGGDNTTTLGSATFRWSTVYAATGTINTSDARTKQQIRELSDAERAVAVRCKRLLRAFKFNDAVEEKGDGARIHFGVIAQDVIAAFAAEGLDAADYALLCHDTWEDQTETWDDEYEDVPAVYSETETDAAGAPIEITPATRKLVKEAGSRVIMEAGDRYGIRYEELLAFMIAAM